MAYQKKTLRTLSPTAKRLAKLINEQQSITRRMKNLLAEIQSLEFEKRKLQIVVNDIIERRPE